MSMFDLVLATFNNIMDSEDISMFAYIKDFIMPFKDVNMTMLAINYYNNAVHDYSIARNAPNNLLEYMKGLPTNMPFDKRTMSLFASHAIILHDFDTYIAISTKYSCAKEHFYVELLSSKFYIGDYDTSFVEALIPNIKPENLPLLATYVAMNGDDKMFDRFSNCIEITFNVSEISKYTTLDNFVFNTMPASILKKLNRINYLHTTYTLAQICNVSILENVDMKKLQFLLEMHPSIIQNCLCQSPVLNLLYTVNPPANIVYKCCEILSARKSTLLISKYVALQLRNGFEIPAIDIKVSTLWLLINEFGYNKTLANAICNSYVIYKITNANDYNLLRQFCELGYVSNENLLYAAAAVTKDTHIGIVNFLLYYVNGVEYNLSLFTKSNAFVLAYGNMHGIANLEKKYILCMSNMHTTHTISS